MSFYILSDEILLIIFNHCDTKDLVHLNSVCKRFYRIIPEILEKRSNHLLVTGQMSKKFRERCRPLLSSYESKFSTYYNWKYGKYTIKMLVHQPLEDFYTGTDLHNHSVPCYMDWYNLQMTKDTIWLTSRQHSIDSDSHYLCALNRTKDGSVSDDNRIIEKCTVPAHAIVSCNNIIVTIHRDGSIMQWTIESLHGRKYFNKKVLNRHFRELNTYPYESYVMDVTSQYIISGKTLEGTIKMWKYTPNKSATDEGNILSNPHSYLQSIAFDSTETKFAAGYCTSNSGASVNYIIYDINKHYTEANKKIDIHDFCHLLWGDPNTIFLQGLYEIKKVDVRTHNVVRTWNDSFSLYKLTCMSSDNLYAIMTGTKNGEVILWDQRMSAAVHRYDITSKYPCRYYKGESISSKISNLQFDSNYMYTVANDDVHEYNFSKI